MKRIFCFAAVSMFVFATTVAAQYTVTGYSNYATVVKNNVALPIPIDSLNGYRPVNKALDVIREDANGKDVTIAFGDSQNPFNASDDYATRIRFENPEVWNSDSGKYIGAGVKWGKISISGSITSEATSVVSVGRDLNIETTANITAKSRTIEVYGGSLTIKSGNIRSLSTSTYDNTAKVSSGGTLKISGGNIWGSVSSSDNGSKLEITGGKIDGMDGIAVYVQYNDTVVISGTAEIVSAAPGKGVIETSIWGNSNITIAGGKVENTDSTGYAVYLTGPGKSLVLSGSPDIKSPIAARFAGKITANAAFAPTAAARYTLKLFGGARVDGAAAVIGGAAKKNNFVFNSPPYLLTAKGADLIVSLPADYEAPSYKILAHTDGIRYIVRKGTSNANQVTDSLYKVVLWIQNDANGRPCNIQLGDSGKVLDLKNNGVYYNNVSYYGLTFNNSVGDGWGRITLSGKTTSQISPDRGGMKGTVNMLDGVSLESTADVNNTASWRYAFIVGSGSDLTIKDGSIKSISISTDGTTTIEGGTITDNSIGSDNRSLVSNGNGTLIIRGGTIKATGGSCKAISNSGDNAYTVISGTTEISSEDTVRTADYTSYSGTIMNERGIVEITSGKISNTSAVGGIAVYNSTYDSTSRTVISGGTITSKNPKGYSSAAGGGTIHNKNGTVEITGGKISNTANLATSNNLGGGFAIVNTGVYNEPPPKTYISGGEITSVSGANYNMATIVNYSSGVMTISGGKISNLWDSTATAVAIRNYAGTLTITGTAEITSKNNGYSDGTIYNQGSNNPWSILSITGGTIKSTADSLGVALSSYIGRGGMSSVSLGGSPTITGYISLYGDGNLAPSILATGDSAFAPGSKKYTIRRTLAPTSNGEVIVTNGARFTSNFDFVLANNANNYRFAASGNDIIATTGDIHTVDFNLRGGVGTPPPTIHVATGAKLGAAAMPPTAPYLDAQKHLNDGKWYRQINTQGELNPAPFVFDTAATGTRVTEDIVLALNWTDQISVLSGDRVIPSTPGVETVVVTPVTITAGELTIGPNPAAKRSGAVNFFWSGKGLASGKLYVYDASGNLVKKVNIADKSGVGKRLVGSWDLTDAKGKPVSEGTYLVKGVVAAKDGTTQKASALIGVVK